MTAQPIVRLVIALALPLAQLESALADVEYTPLFNGKTLEGWTTAAGEPVTKGWAVEEGVLHHTRGGGSLYSAEEFTDFDLRFEWRIAARGNSGVKYRLAYYNPALFGKPGWLGYEYQMWDDAGNQSPSIHTTGAIYDLCAPQTNKQLRPVGEFNTSRIVVQGSKIQHWLGGEQIVEVDTASDEWRDRVAHSKFAVVDKVFQNRSGRIELQDHGHPVWFRRIEIRVLAPGDSPAR